MKVKRTCMAKKFYPHLKLEQRAGKCEPQYMGEEKTIFCSRCGALISIKRNHNGDMGIEHPDNPFNRPGGKPCARYKCNRQAPPDRKYCGPVCSRLAKACRRSEQEIKDRAESQRVVAFGMRAYNSSTLQWLSPAKFAAAVNDITNGTADMSR